MYPGPDNGHDLSPIVPKTMSEEDLTSQNDEIAALTAIFGPEHWIQDITRPVEAFPQYSILIGPDEDLAPTDAVEKSVTLSVTFPPTYPSTSPPAYEIEGPWLSRSLRQKIQGELEELYFENIGENVVFLWIDKVKEILNTFVADALVGDVEASPSRMPRRTEDVEDDLNAIVNDFEGQLALGNDVVVDGAVPVEDDDALWDIPEISSGEAITDRKSTFQAFLARVVHPKQAMRVLEKLLENKKIANAAHNMWAFRVGGEGNRKGSAPVISRCDDDGETHAGGRMLHLLEILGATNVIVIVTRWYGGIMLGPDRFKHISNVTRNILEENGFLKEKKEAVGGKSGKKKT